MARTKRGNGRRGGTLRIRGSRRGKCPRPGRDPRTGKATKYLGHRVPDVAGAGLDSPREFRGIKNAILRDYKSGCISKRTARGRLLLLYRLTYPSHNRKARKISPRTREALRREIRRALERL